ncbi:MAG: KTSC domain-containing protein [Ardenticatenales bacterium]|nr:KTSC domain-containing protein [Ardenticatenales bacterium]
MHIRYVAERDELVITLEPEQGQVIAVLDEQDRVKGFVISRAGQFVQQAIEAGIKLKNLPAAPPPQDGMLWHQASSRMINTFGYDKDKHILEVVFNHIGTYRYYDVPWDIFEGLRNAASKSSYMRTMIIDLYPSEKKKS